MTTKHIITDNIDNLTSIWKSIGEIHQSYTEQPHYAWVDMKDKSWPNRLWLQSTATTENIDHCINTIKSTSTEVLLIHPTNKENNTEHLFLEKGFQISFSQIGMSLPLTTSYKLDRQIELKQVKTNAEAKVWSKRFKQAFGYEICPETISKTSGAISYYLCNYESKALGTLILHQTGKVVGAHALGILPEMRKQGFANTIMKTIINQSIENKAEVMTLQASEMGKNIYLNLGFKTDFILNTYSYSKK